MNTTVFVSAKYPTDTKENIFEHLGEEARRGDTKMKKNCAKSTLINNLKIVCLNQIY